MEETMSSHHALKIAVTILRERCQHFQKRIADLEEENTNLKLMCLKEDDCGNSLTEIDSLKRRLATVEEENDRLKNKMRIVSQENQQLWANFGKLTHINESLGSHLNKINVTLSQHSAQHKPLIRSKTFTHKKQHIVEGEDVEESNKLRLDLEDISLKLINSMSEVKDEMDSLVQDMTEVEILDDIITSSLGFSFDDDNDDIIDDLRIILEELSYIKNESDKQTQFLNETLRNLGNMKAIFRCDSCATQKVILDSNRGEVPRCEDMEKDRSITYSRIEKMCPVCSHLFSEESFSHFVIHVESHFKSE